MSDMITSRPGAITILTVLTIGFWCASAAGFAPPFMRDLSEQKALWQTLGGALLLALRVESPASGK